MRHHGRGAAAAGLACFLLLAACGDDGEQVPLSAGDAAAGRELYGFHCANCHGEEGLGATLGPPLVTELYAPANLPDEAVATAITNGVAEEQWDLGSMPATPGLSSQDVADLVAHVRALQRDAGLIE